MLSLPSLLLKSNIDPVARLWSKTSAGLAGPSQLHWDTHYDPGGLGHKCSLLPELTAGPKSSASESSFVGQNTWFAWFPRCLVNMFTLADKCEVNVSMGRIKTLIRCDLDDTLTFLWWMVFTSGLLWQRGNCCFLQSLSGADKSVAGSQMDRFTRQSSLLFSGRYCSWMIESQTQSWGLKGTIVGCHISPDASSSVVQMSSFLLTGFA